MTGNVGLMNTPAALIVPDANIYMPTTKDGTISVRLVVDGVEPVSSLVLEVSGTRKTSPVAVFAETTAQAEAIYSELYRRRAFQR